MKLFIVIMILVIYVVCKKNSFNSLQKSIKHGESEIGIQIAKRRDCLDDALRIAKLSYEKEVEGIERLTAGDKLERLAFLGQKYPDLQYTNGYQQALGQAMELDRDITAARQILNGNIREYILPLPVSQALFWHLCLATRKKNSLTRKTVPRTDR